ncbi:hypothetical protein SDJN02_17103, partial [Cucurbita argyrosperma subsp. argyrosperma]
MSWRKTAYCSLCYPFVFKEKQANKLVDIKVPQTVLPNTVFEVVVQISVPDPLSEAIVRISYDRDKASFWLSMSMPFTRETSSMLFTSETSLSTSELGSSVIRIEEFESPLGTKNSIQRGASLKKFLIKMASHRL